MAAEQMPEIAQSAASRRRAVYIRAALTHAQYEELPDNEGFYAEIPGFKESGRTRRRLTPAGRSLRRFWTAGWICTWAGRALCRLLDREASRY